MNFRKLGQTLACLRSLRRLEYRGIMELIVIDNQSEPDAHEAIKQELRYFGSRARVVALAWNTGFTGGVLAGWRLASCDLVLLLNNDATMHPKSLSELVSRFEKEEMLGAVWAFDAPTSWSRQQRVPSEKELEQMRNGTQGVLGSNIWLGLTRNYSECFGISGVCALLSRTFVDTPFPEWYFAYHEDVFLSWRIRLRGFSIERVPSAVVYHEGGGGSERSEALSRRLVFHSEKNRISNVLIFYSASTLVKLLPLFVLDETKKLVVCVWNAVRLHPGTRGYIEHLRAVGWVLQSLVVIGRLRRAIQSERRVDDSEILSWLSGRLTGKRTRLSGLLNGLSLSYCRAVGLRTIDSKRASGVELGRKVADGMIRGGSLDRSERDSTGGGDCDQKGEHRRRGGRGPS